MPREPITIDLDEPTYGNPPSEKDVTRITIRCPTGKDIMECGFPFSSARDPRTGEIREIIETRAAYALLARSTGLLIKSFEAMDAVDIYAAMAALKVFFHYSRPTRSSSTSSTPDDGVETAASCSP